jgi:glucose/arabinose dehydrogenase
MKLLTALLSAALLAAMSPAAPVAQSAGARAATEPRTFDTATGQRIRVVTVATGLVHPYSLAFSDARTILVAERAGQLRVIRDGVLQPAAAWTAPGPPASRPPAVNGPDGLHFIALHPRFATNRLVYLSYSKWDDRGTTVAIGRGTLTGDTLTDVREIFAADASDGTGANPGRIFFLRDGTLLFTVGDRDRLCCNGSEDNSYRMRAQDLGNHYGKILRLRDDGTVPPDNPFVERAGARPEIFSYGHRNAYGLAYRPGTDELWESEIGPLGGDEINILQPGRNYGWPLVSTGRNYTGTEVSDRPWSREGMVNPRMIWVPSISPSGLIFYTGDKFKGWKDNAFLGALNGKALWRVAFGQPQQAEKREVLLAAYDARIRDVQQGPDGLLYLATEQASTGPAADGMVLRIEPAP